MAHRYTFFDPMVSFEELPLLAKENATSNDLSALSDGVLSEKHAYINQPVLSSLRLNDVPAPAYEFTDSAKITPESLPSLASASASLQIPGQGVIAVHATIAGDPGAELLFIIRSNNLGSPVLYLHLTPSGYRLYYANDASASPMRPLPGPVLPKVSTSTSNAVIPTTVKLPEDCKLITNDTNTYWLSLDKNNGIIRFGLGYMNVGNTAFEATLMQRDDKVRRQVWVEKQYQFLEALGSVDVLKGGSDQSPLAIQTHTLPLVIDQSPYVLGDQEITLRDIENNIFTVVANLPSACQQLYANVCGSNIKLADTEFPDFAAAIEWSVSTPGKLGYELLKAKADEFGKPDFETTYLRITLGKSLGNSPGQPFVLEIWPSGHHSPIHDHGNACAIIKCLEGEIECSYFDDLKSPRLIGPPATFKKNDVTWIGNNNYQVHQLRNKSPKVCITIQCYQYDAKDTKHYGGFNYITGNQGSKAPGLFDPDSDMTYLAFRAAILKEWTERNASISKPTAAA